MNASSSSRPTLRSERRRSFSFLTSTRRSRSKPSRVRSFRVSRQHESSPWFARIIPSAERNREGDYRLRRTPLPCATTRAQLGLAPVFQPYAITLRRTIGTDGVCDQAGLSDQIGACPKGFLDCRTDIARSGDR